MKAEAAIRARPPELRVLVRAADSAQRARLEGLVHRAGYDVVVLPEEADIVLADGDHLAVEGIPVLAVGSMEPDCAGSLDADATAEQIDAALRAVTAGLLVRSAPPAGGFAAMRAYMPRTLLTPREMEVLGAIGRGLTNKMIARTFGISLHTVKFHVESVFRKLGVRTRAEAVAKALERKRAETIQL